VLQSANNLTTTSTANPTLWDSLQKSVLAGRQDEPPSFLQTLFGRSPNTAATETAETASSPNLLRTVAAAPGTTTVANSAADATPPANSARALPQSSQSIPDDLRPIVQQQLDAVATQRLAWHGEVWPNQHMQWEVDWQSGNNNAEDEEEQVWGTTLSLTTPRLGDVQARLQLTTAGVRIAIVTPIGATAADLRDAAPVLEQSLAAAGVPLLGFLVKHDDQQA
jgi:flagellar hook-length control protein FliK